MNILTSFLPLLVGLLAYALGSLSFAVLVSRVMGLSDPRTFGSKNPGATNVLRSGNKTAAVLTLVLDAAKGWVPIACVATWGAHWDLGAGTQALAALGAFLGHLYPVFFRFKGGKGVATALGVLLGISGWLGLMVLLVWLAVALGFRYSSLAAIVAALAAPAIYALAGGSLWIVEPALALAVVVMSLLLLLRHADNINRLLAGTESKFGQKKETHAAQTMPQRAPHRNRSHQNRSHRTKP
ncbi:MAG: glycerol-3-phosphate 1-O-acyltransferase PlsY [Rhodoferax sp.]